MSFLFDKLKLQGYINCTKTTNTVRQVMIMIVLDLSDKRALYEQIVDRYKDLITGGVLGANEQMPSVRALAMELSINPNTIQRAYTELEREGFIYSVKGRGNFVADISSLLPKQQALYFEQLDNLLEKSEGCQLSEKDVITHISNYFRRMEDK